MTHECKKNVGQRFLFSLLISEESSKMLKLVKKKINKTKPR